MSGFWNDDRTAELRRLWRADKLSSKEIGAQLGCTGNAVIGKAWRLGLSENNRERAGRRMREYHRLEVEARRAQ